MAPYIHLTLSREEGYFIRALLNANVENTPFALDALYEARWIGDAEKVSWAIYNMLDDELNN